MRKLIAWIGIVLIWASASFAQSSDVTPVTLKPGDTLSITVLQDPKFDRTVIVDPNGQIAFPLAGHITVSGLTPQRLERVLKSRLQRNYKDAGELEVTVALTNAAKPDTPEEDLKPKIFITGEVLRPGPYAIRQATTLVQALSLAGGLGPFAARRRIQVRRGSGANEVIFSFDYKSYEAGGTPEANIALQAGDVIIVPERGFLE
ncbi:polysaccharide biosynthesis/export family protein [Bradyrhizobium sp. HKCCYLS3077]|uniref:polysaccharide biosynthesis/export family protein n=1 Tax=unclassified Bradyrhizobium TaxID=2631580 RepID=UPI003EBFDE99